MNKDELLEALAVKISTHEISSEEVISRLGINLGEKKDDKEQKKKIFHFSVTKMLYVLGAAISLIGIIIFVAQIWDDIGGVGRISVTLGLGLMLSAIGSVLFKVKSGEHIGPVFHAIGGLLIPGGAMVTLNELSTGVVTLWPVTITFGILLIFYLLLNSQHKHPVLTFFSIANGTVFIYVFTESVVEGPSYLHPDLYAYLTMVVGVSYLLLAHAFREGWNKKLVSVLLFFGSAGFLGAAFSQVFDSNVWELLFFFVVLGGLYLSVYMKSKSILVISTLFLFAHVIYITAEYFADSLGWPITLVILGFTMIGLGYGAVEVGKKYFNRDKLTPGT